MALTSPDGSKTPAELTQFGDQVLKKRLENVRGVGSVSLVGSLKREINIYLKPTALEAFGVSADQVMNAVRSENRDLPAGALGPATASASCRSTAASSHRPRWCK